jgi:hypothetical protein
LSGFGKVARASLAAMTAGVLIVILVGLLLVWFGLAGYKDWSASQRVSAGGLGLVDAIGFGFLLAVLLRQQVAGLPRAGATTGGLAVGSALIPWAEIDDIGATSLFGLPHVAIVQASTAPKRLQGLRSLQYMPLGDRRMLFLGARQVGTDLRGDVEQIRQAWSRARSIEADFDPGTPRCPIDPGRRPVGRSRVAWEAFGLGSRSAWPLVRGSRPWPIALEVVGHDGREGADELVVGRRREGLDPHDVPARSGARSASRSGAPS